MYHIVCWIDRDTGCRAGSSSVAAIAVSGVLHASTVVGIGVIGEVGAVAPEAIASRNQADTTRGGHGPQCP